MDILRHMLQLRKANPLSEKEKSDSRLSYTSKSIFRFIIILGSLQILTLIFIKKPPDPFFWVFEAMILLAFIGAYFHVHEDKVRIRNENQLA